MWKRFIKAMEYRSYCMAIRQLRQQGMHKEAEDISKYKHQLFDTASATK